MCLSNSKFLKILTPLTVNQRLFHVLHHRRYSRFSSSRHRIFANKSLQLSFASTETQFSHSVFVDSPATAHIKNSTCWIDRKSFSVLSRLPIVKRQKSIGENYKTSFKMVWISNLDNPEVNDPQIDFPSW